MRTWSTWARLAIGVVVLVGMDSGCANGLFYQPTRRVYQTPADHALRYEPVTFTSADGTGLTGWFVPAVGVATGTVVHVHGNAQNMTAHFSFVDWLPACGFNVFVFDYRGYGQSAGEPERARILEDCAAALKVVQARADVDPERVVVLGQSLGGASVLVALARHPEIKVRAVAIDSAFSSYRRITREKIALIPVLSLLRWPLSYLVVSDRYSPEDYLDELPPVPLLFIHGTADRVVPFGHSERLFERARAPKGFWAVEGGDHAEALVRYGERYRRALAAFFTAALDGPVGEVPSAPAEP